MCVSNLLCGLHLTKINVKQTILKYKMAIFYPKFHWFLYNLNISLYIFYCWFVIYMCYHFVYYKSKAI